MSPHSKNSPSNSTPPTAPSAPRPRAKDSTRFRSISARWIRSLRSSKPTLKSSPLPDPTVALCFTQKELNLLALALSELEHDAYLSERKQLERRDLEDRIATALREVRRKAIGCKLMTRW